LHKCSLIHCEIDAHIFQKCSFDLKYTEVFFFRPSRGKRFVFLQKRQKKMKHSHNHIFSFSFANTTSPKIFSLELIPFQQFSGQKQCAFIATYFGRVNHIFKS